jgi:hypothetical protein
MPELQERDAAAWWRALSRLQRLLRTAAASLHSRGLFTYRQMHHYSMSVTEREVLKGCIEAKSRECKVLDDDIPTHPYCIYRVHAPHFADLG